MRKRFPHCSTEDVDFTLLYFGVITKEDQNTVKGKMLCVTNTYTVKAEFHAFLHTATRYDILTKKRARMRCQGHDYNPGRWQTARLRR